MAGVSKRYDDEAGVLDALKAIDLTIEDGDAVVIMGPSGSGKSTLMNLLGLLDRPTGGEYSLDGVDITTLNDKQLAALRRDKIGFIFQQFNLLPRFSILQNVELPMIYQGVKRSERRDRAKKALAEVGLADKLKNKPQQLSGGQIQRAAIARALVNNPSLILADEPTGNLDTKTSKEILEVLSDLNKKKGVTLVIVTHNPELADYANRVVKVIDGEVTQGKGKLK
jgi:putative ABC transport system ATP-binding protein